MRAHNVFFFVLHSSLSRSLSRKLGFLGSKVSMGSRDFAETALSGPATMALVRAPSAAGWGSSTAS